MRLLSLNISNVKTVEWKGKEITTGIFKKPVTERLNVQGVNIAGDDQADRRVHGGKYKAIYGYAAEHYPFWKEKYPDHDFAYGMFGENLTTEGLLEQDLFIGDIFEIGSTQLQITEPRMPCYKLGIKFGTQKIVKDFANAKKPGFYFSIVKEGEIKAGDKIQLINKDPEEVGLLDMVEVFRQNVDPVKDRPLLDKIVEHKAINPEIKFHIKTFLQSLDK